MSKENRIKYDNLLLSRLNHLQRHPNYLPHIGKNFEQASQRIIIVAESHYIPEEFDGLITADSWHNEPEKIYSTIGGYSGWFNTRGVLENYFYKKNEKKVSGGLTIFFNLEKAYKTVYILLGTNFAAAVINLFIHLF